MPDQQSLFDALAGASGHPINRAGLDSYVSSSQTLNGLRSAQTEEAMLKATQAQEEQKAAGELEGALGNLLGPGHESAAHAMATFMKGHFGDAKSAAGALGELQQNQFHATLGDPNQLNTPAQTAAQQGIKGSVAEPVTAPKEFVQLPGMEPAHVQQTPLGEAETSEKNAQAGLHTAQTNHPQLFHPSGQPATPEEIAQAAEFIRHNPNAAPTGRALTSPNGMAIVKELNKPTTIAPNADGTPGTDPTAGVSLKEQADIRNDFAKGKAAQSTTALNTMANHASLMDAVANQLDNGDFTPSNKVKNLWGKMFGGSAPTNLKIVGGFLGREAVKATVNSGSGTGEEREFQLGDDASPTQLHDAAAIMRRLGGGQLASLKLRAQRGGVDINQLLDPIAQDAYHMQTGPATGAGAGGGAGGGPNPSEGLPVKVATDDDYNKLKSGALFIDPDGHTRRKP